MIPVEEVDKLLAVYYPRYSCTQLLGSGACGTVAKLKDTVYPDGAWKALKLVPVTLDSKKNVLGEVLNHRMLRHPHVIQFSRVLLFPGMLGIVMEYASSGCLFDYVKARGRIQEGLARFFFQQIVIAVDYCHRKGVVNRDIKLENILLHEDSAFPIAKLCDFGYSKHIEGSMAKSLVGSPEYMAPEIVTEVEYDAKLIDVWCCGVVLYVMIVGRYPFEAKGKEISAAERRAMVARNITNLNYTIPDYVSQKCRNLLQKILVLQSDRISVADILNDPWFQKGLSKGALVMNDNIIVEEKELMDQMDRIQSPKHISRLIDAAVMQPRTRIQYQGTRF